MTARGFILVRINHGYQLQLDRNMEAVQVSGRDVWVSQDDASTRKAAEFLFSCQKEEGDIRGFLANQYATYYTGAIMALLIKAGYEDDPRIERVSNGSWQCARMIRDGPCRYSHTI